MIYTASYFWQNHHHGLKIVISETIPKGFKFDSQLDFFMPSNYLLNAWKKRKIDKEEYTRRYGNELRANLIDVRLWLKSLKPNEDMTLLCWEGPGLFCHRNLVAKVIKQGRPDCWGGADTAK